MYSGRGLRRRVPPHCPAAALSGTQPDEATAVPLDPGHSPQPGGPQQTRRKTALLNDRGERQASIALGLIWQHRKGLGSLPRDPDPGGTNVDTERAGGLSSVPTSLRSAGSVRPVSFAEQEEAWSPGILGAGQEAEKDEEGATWTTCKLQMPGSWRDEGRGCDWTCDEPTSPSGSSFSARGSGGSGQVTWLPHDRVLRASLSLGSGATVAGPAATGPQKPNEGPVSVTGLAVSSGTVATSDARSLDRMRRLSLSASFARLRRPQKEFPGSEAVQLDPTCEEAGPSALASEPAQATQSSTEEPRACPGIKDPGLEGSLSQTPQQGDHGPLDRSVSDFPRRSAPRGLDGRLSGGLRPRLTRLSSVMMSSASAQSDEKMRPGIGGGLRLDRGGPGLPRSLQRFTSGNTFSA